MSYRLFASVVGIGCMAAVLLSTGVVRAAAPPVRPPHQYAYIVYFNPADRECLPNYRERLDRVMTVIQSWYRDEMVRNGFGPMTFPLERDEDGHLIIHIVKSSRTYALGEEITADEMYGQVKDALRLEGIDTEQEHILVFANAVTVSERDGAIVYLSSSNYCGNNGSHKHGEAYVTDVELLDPLNLPKKEPKILDGGVRPYTLGGYNVTYIGGTAHEFGHALGLPHNKQTDEELKTLGHALMCDGNYYLFAERTGAEKGAFLSKAHATILSSHPLFRRDATDVDVKPACTFHEIAFAPGEAGYTVTGRVSGSPRPYAVVAYHDGVMPRRDYDASSWVGMVDEAGRFEVHVQAPTPGEYELRLRFFVVSGAYQELAYRFLLDQTLQIPVSKLNRQTIYELNAKPAIEAWDPQALNAAIEKLAGMNDVYLRRAKAYYHLMTQEPVTPVSAVDVDPEVREIPLTSIAYESATVGWEKPAYNVVPGEPGMPLESGEQFHETGIYAHADSRYVYNLSGQWKKLTSAYGLHRMCDGSVVFSIKCDGRERFRSDVMQDYSEGLVEVDLSGVQQLELIVEDAGDGKWGDCGIWFSPKLTR
jgi:hypothetical protein